MDLFSFVNNIKIMFQNTTQNKANTFTDMTRLDKSNKKSMCGGVSTKFTSSSFFSSPHSKCYKKPKLPTESI